MFSKANDSTLEYLEQAGFMFPTQKPSISDQLPDEWDSLMEQEGGMMRLQSVNLEDYLEKWDRLVGYAKWVRGVWNDRVEALERLHNYVKDYIFTRVEGGSRELRGAVAGSHPITLEVLEQLNEWSRKRNVLDGLIYKWEGIKFSISRTITNRQSR
jgi:hypothetical protein